MKIKVVLDDDTNTERTFDGELVVWHTDIGGDLHIHTATYAAPGDLIRVATFTRGRHICAEVVELPPPGQVSPWSKAMRKATML